MFINDASVYQLAVTFHDAIQRAKAKGFFKRDLGLDDFPVGSCGDASYLLAEFFLLHGIKTIWVTSRRSDWTHAWLAIKDDRVVTPVSQLIDLPDGIKDVFAQYGNPSSQINTELTYYKEEDLENALIVDITGDQFDDYNIPVYVGFKDSFHRTFDFIQAVDFDRLSDGRLLDLYRTIMSNF